MPGITSHESDSSTMIGVESPLSKEQPVSQYSFNDQISYNLHWQIRNRKDHNPVSLYQPYGIAFNTDDIFVAEGLWPYSRLQVFSAKTGRSRRSLVQGQILPFGVVVDRGNGVIAMTDHKDRTVKFLAPDLNKLSSWPEELFDWPTGIDVNERGRYCVTDWYKGRLTVHDQDGRIVMSFCSSGDNLKEHSCPMYVAFDSHQRIAISDTFDHTIKVFSDAGQLLLKIGDKPGPGKIVDPRGICVDRCGNIVVADWGSNRIKVYSDDGVWIQDVLTKDDGIQHPWGIAINDNLMAITEQKLSGDPSLKLFSSTGSHYQPISTNN